MFEKKMPEKNLNGKNVCLIGGAKSQYYSQVIERYNGKIKFVSCEDFKKIPGAVKKSSAVFFLTKMNSHMNYQKMTSITKKLNIPVIYIHSLGKKTFEKKLQSFIQSQC